MSAPKLDFNERPHIRYVIKAPAFYLNVCIYYPVAF